MSEDDPHESQYRSILTGESMRPDLQFKKDMKDFDELLASLPEDTAPQVKRVIETIFRPMQVRLDLLGAEYIRLVRKVGELLALSTVVETLRAVLEDNVEKVDNLARTGEQLAQVVKDGGENVATKVGKIIQTVKDLERQTVVEFEERFVQQSVWNATANREHVILEKRVDKLARQVSSLERTDNRLVGND